MTPELCNAIATDVRWVFTRLEGVQGTLEFVEEPDAVSGTPGGFDDGEPPQPLPAVCIFRSELGLTTGTWAVEAQLTFDGTPWSGGCTVNPSQQDLDTHQCEVADWVGFTAQGFTPGSSECLVAFGDPDFGCGPGDQVGGNWGDFPAPD